MTLCGVCGAARRLVRIYALCCYHWLAVVATRSGLGGSYDIISRAVLSPDDGGGVSADVSVDVC